MRSLSWRGLLKKNRTPQAGESVVRGPNSRCLPESTVLDGKNSHQAYIEYLFAGSDDVPLTLPQKLVLSSVREALGKKDSHSYTIPRLPAVIPRLLRSLRDPDSSARDYYEIINKDPMLSAAILKLANSVYFNRTGIYIDNIEKAIVKLGIDGLRSVLSAAVMQPIIQKESTYFSHTGQRLWQHTLECAVACELGAQHRKLEPYKAYLMGLMHDLGKIAVFSALCKEHRLNGDPNPGKNAFIPLFDSTAQQLSFQIAQDWQLPEEMCLALQEQVIVVADKPISAYGRLLFEANMICETLAATPRDKRIAVTDLLADLQFPQDIMDKLRDIGRQI